MADFFDALSSCVRVITSPAPGKEKLVFQQQSTQALALARSFGVDPADIFDTLEAAAVNSGLVKQVGGDVVQGWIAEAANPRISNANASQPPITDGAAGRSKLTQGLEVVCMADVQAKPIEWLWKDWLAIGKASMLAGEGGQGKSTILCDLTARLSTGDRGRLTLSAARKRWAHGDDCKYSC